MGKMKIEEIVELLKTQILPSKANSTAKTVDFEKYVLEKEPSLIHLISRATKRGEISEPSLIVDNAIPDSILNSSEAKLLSGLFEFAEVLLEAGRRYNFSVLGITPKTMLAITEAKPVKSQFKKGTILEIVDTKIQEKTGRTLLEFAKEKRENQNWTSVQIASEIQKITDIKISDPEIRRVWNLPAGVSVKPSLPKKIPRKLREAIKLIEERYPERPAQETFKLLYSVMGEEVIKEKLGLRSYVLTRKLTDFFGIKRRKAGWFNAPKEEKERVERLLGEKFHGKLKTFINAAGGVEEARKIIQTIYDEEERNQTRAGKVLARKYPKIFKKSIVTITFSRYMEKLGVIRRQLKSTRTTKGYKRKKERSEAETQQKLQELQKKFGCNTVNELVVKLYNTELKPGIKPGHRALRTYTGLGRYKLLGILRKENVTLHKRGTRALPIEETVKLLNKMANQQSTQRP